MSLSFTVLGCAGSYAGPGDACSGYLVRSPGAVIVLDLGPGTLANLQRHVELADVDAVVLTHEHPDHWLDLPLLRNAMRYYLGLEGLAVYGTAGVLERARVVIGEFEPTLRWTVIDALSEIRIGDQRLRFDRTDHPVETLAVRLELGDGEEAAESLPGEVTDRQVSRSLVYSADTGAQWPAERLARHADLFVCEATLADVGDGHGLPHLSGRQAGELGRVSGAARLVITHVAPGVDAHAQREAAEAAFGGPVELARTHATFVL